MRPGKAELPLRGQASNHGAQADRLESFARPCLLAAHWLASEPGATEKLSRKRSRRGSGAGWCSAPILPAGNLGPDCQSPPTHCRNGGADSGAPNCAPVTLGTIAKIGARQQGGALVRSIRGSDCTATPMFFSVMTLASGSGRFCSQQRRAGNAALDGRARKLRWSGWFPK